MSEHIDYEHIFTPQGILGHVSKHPNLDFLMNIFNIPRVSAVKEAIASIQQDILNAFSIEEDQELHHELKLLDMIGFLYEISQSSPRGIDPSKADLIKQMYARQKTDILAYAQQEKIDPHNVEDFLHTMKL